MFDEYLQFGGFPLIGISNFDNTSAYQVVEGIYSAVITRDISKRHKIRNKDLFDRVVKYVIENVGKTFSANSIVVLTNCSLIFILIPPSKHQILSVSVLYDAILQDLTSLV